MRKLILILFLFVVTAVIAAAQPLTGPGNRYMYQFDSLANWQAEPQEAFELKLNYVLRPTNTADRLYTSIIVSRFSRPEGKDPLAEFIKQDTATMKKETPQLSIKRLRLKLDNLENDKVIQGKYQSLELSVPKSEPKVTVIYVDMDESICMLALVTATEQLYKQYWDDYLTLVKSFQVIPVK